jgi:hypothetical protein
VICTKAGFVLSQFSQKRQAKARREFKYMHWPVIFIKKLAEKILRLQKKNLGRRVEFPTTAGICGRSEPASILRNCRLVLSTI